MPILALQQEPAKRTKGRSGVTYQIREPFELVATHLIRARV